jgi:hypothetical protein
VETFAPSTKRIDQSAIGLAGNVQSIGFAADEAITVIGDLSTLGVAAFQNLDATNYVEIGPDSGGALVGFIRLEPGEFATMRLKPGITIRAQANTAAVKLRVWILND